MAGYNELHGLRVKYLSADPSNAENGQVWYNSTSGNLRVQGIGSGAWSSTSPMANSVQYRGGGGTPTAMFAAGGSLSTNLTEEYNGIGWSPGGNIGTARYEMGSAGTLTAGLIFGGYNNPPASTKNETEEYNGTSWSEQNNLNTARYSQGGFGIQTAAVYSSGFNPSSLQTDTEEYNGTSWSEGNNPAQARYDVGTGGTLTAGIIFGGGGATAPVVYANTELYDGTNWTAGPAMNTARSTLGGSGTQTAAIGFGGRSTPVVAITEQFDGTSWTEVGDLATARRNITANRSNTGNSEAIAAGGSPGSGTVTLVEEWNFTSDTITPAAWSAGGNMGTARYGPQGFGVSQTSQVAVGGLLGSPTATANSESYNGTSWSEGNNLNTARANGAGGGTETAGIVALGRNPSANPSPQVRYALTEEYDGTSYSEVNDCPESSYRKVGAGTQTALMVCGGIPPGFPPYADTSFEYDGTNWTAGGTMPQRGDYTDGVGVTTAAVVFGAINSPSPNTNNACLDYDGSSFSANNNMNIVHGGQHTVAGTVTAALVAGGGGPYGVAAAAETYDGTSFTSNAVLGQPGQRGGKSGTSTAAIAAGGANPGASPGPSLASTEEYNVGSTTTGPASNITTS